tara:strand:+ start:25110 stop:25397 length:288 start_codon:yes stop_codon:yes gene_type:complete
MNHKRGFGENSNKTLVLFVVVDEPSPLTTLNPAGLSQPLPIPSKYSQVRPGPSIFFEPSNLLNANPRVIRESVEFDDRAIRVDDSLKRHVDTIMK